MSFKGFETKWNSACQSLALLEEFNCIKKVKWLSYFHLRQFCFNYPHNPLNQWDTKLNLTLRWGLPYMRFLKFKICYDMRT